MRFVPLLILVSSLTISSCSNSTAAPTPAPIVTPTITFTGGSFFSVGQTSQLGATELLATSTTQDVTKTATWLSSNTSVATVSSTGFLTALAPGTSIVTANNSGTIGSLVVSVANNTVTALLVVGPSSLPTGQVSQLAVTASTTSGMNQVVTNSVTWQSSNPAVAAVSSTGLLTALAPGTATITATFAGVTGTLAVTAINETVTSIVLYGTTTIVSGATSQLIASATLADGSAQVVTNLATWQSSNPSAATVSSSGLVTWVATGVTTITATYLGTTGSVDITEN